MKRVAHIKWVAIAVLLVSAPLSLMLGTPASAQQGYPALAQEFTSAIDLRVAAFSGFPVYSVGLPRKISPDFDLVILDSFQPTPGGVTGNLLDVGIRYDFTLQSPKGGIFLGVGFASEYGPFPGFGFANASGYSIGAGAAIQLNDKSFVYASGRIVSLGGTSNSVVDLGWQFTPGLSLGYISFAGSGAPYLELDFPCIFCGGRLF